MQLSRVDHVVDRDVGEASRDAPDSLDHPRCEQLHTYLVLGSNQSRSLLLAHRRWQVYVNLNEEFHPELSGVRYDHETEARAAAAIVWDDGIAASSRAGLKAIGA